MRLVVDWIAPDPAALGARLADRLRLPRPDPDDERFALLLGDGVIRIAASGAGGRERIVDASPVEEGGGSPVETAEPPGVRLLGVAWATVELARGARELAARFGLDPDDFAVSTEDGWLGAASRVARLGRSGLVALEPVTEGRVAAALARFGEGPVGVYLGLPGPAAGAVRPGPLGAGSLLPGAPAWGPFTIVLGMPATAGDRSRDGAAGTIDG